MDRTRLVISMTFALTLTLISHYCGTQCANALPEMLLRKADGESE